MTTRTSQLKTLRRAAASALAILAIVAVAAAPADARSSALMTLRGKVTANGYAMPGSAVYAFIWNGTSWARSAQTTADSAGNYALVVSRQRSYYLAAVKTYGTQCRPWGGYYVFNGKTAAFYTDLSWHNPTYINIAVTLFFNC